MNFEHTPAIAEAISTLRDKAAVRKVHLDRLKTTEQHIAKLTAQVEVDAKARVLVQEAATETQNNLRIHLSGLVTSALQAVFGPKYKFHVAFEAKRGRTECVLSFEDQAGNLTAPTEAHGGGAVDIASFALRCSFWSMQRTAPLLILDEPFKFLSAGLVPEAAEMLKSVAHKLGLQVIMVSHIEKLVDIADRVFLVTNDGKSATVTVRE